MASSVHRILQTLSGDADPDSLLARDQAGLGEFPCHQSEARTLQPRFGGYKERGVTLHHCAPLPFQAKKTFRRGSDGGGSREQALPTPPEENCAAPVCVAASVPMATASLPCCFRRGPAWGSIILGGRGGNDAYFSSSGDKPSQYFQQHEVSYFLGNAQLRVDWWASQVRWGDRLGVGKEGQGVVLGSGLAGEIHPGHV